VAHVDRQAVEDGISVSPPEGFVHRLDGLDVGIGSHGDSLSSGLSRASGSRNEAASGSRNSTFLVANRLWDGTSELDWSPGSS